MCVCVRACVRACVCVRVCVCVCNCFILTYASCLWDGVKWSKTVNTHLMEHSILIRKLRVYYVDLYTSGQRSKLTLELNFMMFSFCSNYPSSGGGGDNYLPLFL